MPRRRHERDKLDLGLIVEGGRCAQPSKRLQGLDYPAMITNPCTKPQGKNSEWIHLLFENMTHLHDPDCRNPIPDMVNDTDG